MLEEVQLSMKHIHKPNQPTKHSSGVNSAFPPPTFAGNVATLASKRELSPGDYYVLMRIYDADMLYQDSTLEVEVCQCQGAVFDCFIPHSAPRLHIPSLATSVLGAIFVLLRMYQIFLIHPMSEICFGSLVQSIVYRYRFLC